MYPIPKKRSPCSIINRRYQPCAEIVARSPEFQIGVCSYCYRFVTQTYISENKSTHYRTHVVFTDGACLNNGQANPSSGWGIATGASKSQCYVSPFDCSFGQRTNQRAELTGAYEGMIRGLRDMKKSCPHYEQLHTDNGDRMELLLVTDSEYVVKTMTKWLPKWKANDMKTSFGQTPANLDIISHFDDRIEFLRNKMFTSASCTYCGIAMNWLISWRSVRPKWTGSSCMGCREITPSTLSSPLHPTLLSPISLARSSDYLAADESLISLRKDRRLRGFFKRKVLLERESASHLL
ncbi:ribonuclease H-like domain-containing protein [Phyllosticta capitalensis]|uniref:ribonuclease H-like domain-containing protein n=1 Tax=Phyllosticta capitalensis TaxID=121624 RepID=UPI00312E988D